MRNAELEKPIVLRLPGSRAGELRRHLPVMVPAARRMADETGAALKLVLPSETMRTLASPLLAPLPQLQIQIG